MRNDKKDKIFIGIAVLVVVIIIAIVAIVIHNNGKTEVQDIVLPKDEIEIAPIMLVPNDNGLSLVNIDGTILDTVEGNIMFRVSEDNDLMYLNNDVLYTASIDKVEGVDENGEEKDTYDFNETKIMDASDVVDFTFNDKYIAFLKASSMEATKVDDDVASDEETSNLTKEINMASESPFYDVVFVDRDTLKEVSTLVGVQIDDDILFNDTFVYSITNKVYSVDIATLEVKDLYLGKEVSDLDLVNDKLIIFDKFGNGDGKSLILQVNEDLSIDKATKHDAPDLVEIQQDALSEDIIYIEVDDTPTLYLLNLDGDRETKKKTNLNLKIDGTYSDDNTIYCKGYIYTAKDGKVNIIDLKSATIYKTFDIDASYVYPIFETSTDDAQ
jgi:hypothetical protein